MSLLIGHFTDLHITVPANKFKNTDSTANVNKIIQQLNNLTRKPDIVILTGDLVHEGIKEEYIVLVDLLDKLKMPYYVIPGNHDERNNFRNAFSHHSYLPQQGEFLHYEVDNYPLKLIGLDSLIPSKPEGQLCQQRLAWLDTKLQSSAKPTLLFMHHPPYLSGIDFMDRFSLKQSEDFANVLKKYNHIVGILTGHYHRSIFTRFANIPVCTLASCTAQILPDFSHAKGLTWVAEPPVFALHKWDIKHGLASLPVVATDNSQIIS